MFRTKIFRAPVANIANKAKADALDALKTAHFISTFNPSILSLEQQKQLLHAAIRRQEYDVAKMFLNRETVFSKDEYGDSPVVMALNNKAWDFLECARGYVETKSPEVDFVFRIVRSEADPVVQEMILGYAKDFFDIDQ